jgi:hypothetical protein
MNALKGRIILFKLPQKPSNTDMDYKIDWKTGISLPPWSHYEWVYLAMSD